jgi:hypothetical protein
MVLTDATRRFRIHGLKKGAHAPHEEHPDFVTAPQPVPKLQAPLDTKLVLKSGLRVTATLEGGPIGRGWRLVHATGCSVVGLDLNAEFCDLGEELNRCGGIADRVTLQVGDANDVSRFGDGSFAAIGGGSRCAAWSGPLLSISLLHGAGPVAPGRTVLNDHVRRPIDP